MLKQILIFCFLVLYVTAQAQSPAEINYQAIVRDGTGQSVANNTPVQFIFSIHNLTPTGSTVFTETTGIILANQFGLCNTSIGKTVSLSTVNWSSGNKYLQVQVKVNNGSFTDMGTTQLLSVPYALYSGTAGAITGGSTSSGSSYVVKYNGIPITDSTINHVSMECSGTIATCLTDKNYWYNIYRGLNTVQSLAAYAVLADDTLSVTPTLYLYSSPLNCSNSVYPYEGQVIAVNTNHTTGIYYVPLNAIAASNSGPLYQYNCNTNHWQLWNMQFYPTYKYYQIIANNPIVTGFNLSFPVTMTISR